MADSAEVQRLKEIAEFRARFLNMAAHELKTPLTPIRLQLQILGKYLADASPEVKKSLAILGRGVERLQTLMQDVLDAARIQADRLKLRNQALSLSDVAREAAENYQAVASSLNVRLAVDVEPGVAVVGDPERLLQVTTNLLSNALKFTPAGGHVELRLHRRGPVAELVVQDSGRGMDASQLARLFQPFTQVHEDLEAIHKGTGLGLYITKSILEQQGGTITMASPGPGKGTIATVMLPLTQDAPLPIEKRPAPTGMRQRLREMI